MKTFEFAQTVEVERILLVQAETEEEAREAVADGDYDIDSEEIIREDVADRLGLLSVQGEDGEFIDGI